MASRATAIARPSAREDPDALVARLCDETRARLAPGGFVLGLGARADPLSGALRDATLSYVRSVRDMFADDLRAARAAGAAPWKAALLADALGRAEALRARLIADAPYPSASVVAELIALKSHVAQTCALINNDGDGAAPPA